jgi:tetratricopeptide (TPR) repeat protein
MVQSHRDGEPAIARASERFAERVLLIGWDGADRFVLRRLLAEGRLPHLASLLEQGTCLELVAPRPHETSAVWTSLATAKWPADHGVLHSACPSPDGIGVQSVSRSSRHAAAIWNILSRPDLRAHVVGWPVTHPAESISGVCVSEWFAVPRLHAQSREGGEQSAVSPSAVYGELRARRVAPSQVEELTLLQFIPRQATGLPERDHLLGICRTLIAESVTLFRATRWCLTEKPWDFAACVFPGIKIAHELANWLQGTSDPAGEIARELCDRCYEHHDLLLGQLLSLVGENCHVVAVSPCDYGTAPNSQAGLAVIRGPGVQSRVVPTPRSALDLVPTILAMFGVPYGKDMGGRPWLDILPPNVKSESVETWDTNLGPDSQNGIEEFLVPERSQSADAIAANAAVRHLVELGYVDPKDTTARELADCCRRETELNRVVSLLESGRTQLAITKLKQLAEQNPDWLQPHEMLAKAYYQTNERHLAKQEIDWLSWHGDEAPQLYFLTGAIALDQRQFDRALAHLRCAKRAQRPLPGLMALEGSVHLRKRDFAAAKAAFQSSIAVDGPTSSALDGLATICLQSGQREDAALHALEALERDMQFGRAHYHLGLALLQLNRLPEAQRAFESWAAADPLQAASYRWLAHLAERHLNDPSQAATYRNQARQVVRKRRTLAKTSRSDGTSTPSSAR